jgi:hypothetical protein
MALYAGVKSNDFSFLLETVLQVLRLNVNTKEEVHFH